MNYNRTGTQQMHTHAEVADGCNIIILLYYNYGKERGHSETSTVTRLVKAMIHHPIYWLGHCQAYATNRIDKYIHKFIYFETQSFSMVSFTELDLTT